MNNWIACDRKDTENKFGGRCRNQATANGRCEEVPSHRDGSAPRAEPPNVVLVKFKLWGNAYKTAEELFRSVRRDETGTRSSHELIALMAQRQFKGVRNLPEGADDPGDSGGQIFGPEGVKGPDSTRIGSELGSTGFHLADIHCWSKPGSNEGFLVLGYRKEPGILHLLTGDHLAFLERQFHAPWDEAHIWDNIPEWVASLRGDEGNFIKFLPLEVNVEAILVQMTKPKVEEAYWIPKNTFASLKREILHTVNMRLVPPKRKVTVERRPVVVYNNGLWGLA